MSKVEEKERVEIKEEQSQPQPMDQDEYYRRLDLENNQLRNEIRYYQEQNDLLRRLINTQSWLIDEYQRRLKTAGYSEITSRGV